MESQYTSFNLQMVNLIIAMCHRNPSVPALFAELGYTEFCIELQFANSENEGVTPEIMICSEDKGHTILWEFKSGGSLDQDQLRRYAGVTTEDIRENAHVRARACGSLDVALVVPDSKTVDCTTILEEWGFAFPLIEKAKNTLSLVANKFCVDELNAGMAAKLIIDFGQLPLHYVPFDSESPVWVYAQQAGQKLIAYMHRRVPRIGLSQFAMDVIPAWVVLSRKQQGVYKRKLQDALLEMAGHEFRAFLRRNREIAGTIEGPVWDIIENPLDEGSDKRTQAFQMLKKQLQRCMERLKEGQRTLDVS